MGLNVIRCENVQGRYWNAGSRKLNGSRRIQGKVEGSNRSEGERKVCESDHLRAEWCDYL